jgi:hypothetical protein
MKPAESPRWRHVFVGSVTSGVFCSLLTLWVVGLAPHPLPLDGRDRLDVGSILSRLDDLGHRIESRLADVRSASDSLSTARTPVEEVATATRANGDLVDRLDRLEQRLDQALLLLKSSAGSGAELSLMRSKPVQQDQLDALAAMERRDSEAATRSTMLLTPAEVIARFGFPDDVSGANGGGTSWNYRHRGPNGEIDGGIVFFFREGHVAWHEISVPDR